MSKAKEQRAGARTLFTSRDKPGIIADTLVVRADILRDRPKDVEAVVAALFDATAELKANPVEMNAIAGKGLGLSADEFAEQAKTVRFLTPEENMMLFDRAAPHNLYELTRNAAEIFRTDDVIRGEVNADAVVDPSVMRAYISHIVR